MTKLILGKLGMDLQSIMYSPPMTGVPPSNLLILENHVLNRLETTKRKKTDFVTSLEGPAIRLVPVSAMA